MWTMKCPFTLPSPSPNDIAFSPSFMGLNIAICFKDGSVNIYRPQDVFQLWSWQKESSFLLNKQANCLSWCKSRNHVVSMIIGTEDDAQIWEQDPATRQWEKKWVVSENCGTIRNVAWSPNFGRDYETVATASSDGCIRIYEIRSMGKTMTACLRDHGRDVWRIQWNMMGTILASSGNDNTVRMWKRKFDVSVIGKSEL
ncbi:hypothetical protein WA538_001997 [Blastocystis sp. DL]